MVSLVVQTSFKHSRFRRFLLFALALGAKVNRHLSEAAKGGQASHYSLTLLTMPAKIKCIIGKSTWTSLRDRGQTEFLTLISDWQQLPSS